MNNCPNLAEYVYPWAGEIKHACNKHVNAMKNLSDAMGAPFNAEPDFVGMAAGRKCDHANDLGEV